MLHKCNATLLDVPCMQNLCLHSLFNVFIIYSTQGLSTWTIVLIPVCYSKSCFTWREMSNRSIGLCQGTARSKVCIHHWICAANMKDIRVQNDKWCHYSGKLGSAVQCGWICYVISLQKEEDNLEAHLINRNWSFSTINTKLHAILGSICILQILFEIQSYISYQIQV
jgi:hypothetical protein